MNNNPGKTNTIAVIVMLSGIALIIVVTIAMFQSNRATQIVSGPVNTSAQAEPTDNGNDIVTVEGELVEDFPPFPAYTGAKLIKSSQIAYQEKEGFSAIWTTGDSVNAIAKFYMDTAQKNKWQVTSSPSNNSSSEQSIELQVNGRPVIINIEREAGQATTEIEISFLPQ